MLGRKRKREHAERALEQDRASTHQRLKVLEHRVAELEVAYEIDRLAPAEPAPERR